ncbi:MAG: DNA mismatch repair protein MutS [bacterium]|jgi:DNA mismatch repair protein MutS|nr:DNA mismatch repair protein MutS [bacterium]
MAKELTPAMEQYMRFKEQHPDAILLFRMGDFYETFFEDAVIASQLLGLTLTSRNNGSSSRTPLAGLPYHALDGYLARLIRAGRKVAICEQMEPPQKGKKVVRREVVQVVSPGTVLSDDLLDQKQNNYLMGLFVEGERLGLVTAELSTGVFQVTERAAGEVWEVLARVNPAEVVATESWAESNEKAFREQLPGVLLTRIDDWYFGRAYAYGALKEHFRVSSLKGFGCDDLTVGVSAAGGVLSYLRENQKGAISHMTRLSYARSDAAMELDLVTQRNLELITTMQDGRREGTLISVMDRTCTSPGARAMRTWLSQPLLDIDQIEARLDAVQELVEQGTLREAVRDALRRVGDLERMMSKICCGRASPRDILGLGHSLAAVEPLRESLAQASTPLLCQASQNGMPDLGELIKLIGETLAEDPPALLNDGGIIRKGYHAELDELRDIASGGRNWVARLQERERQETGIASLKVGYNRAFGYYIEVTQSNMDKVPDHFIRKQTLVNAERFITPDLKEWEAKILGADERSKELEKDLFIVLREAVAQWVEPVQVTASSVSTVDVLASLAEVAVANDYVRPTVDGSTRLDVRRARHPAVEQILPSGQFVPNDLLIDGESDQILIITGPNMAGKSTILRTAGLIVLLAQVGSYVPASEAHIGVVDRIFTRVGASDNLSRGESTFLVEMNEAANILNNATPKSLVLLDEIGRGTSTFDGLSIAWAMTEHLHNTATLQPRTMFATHYHELTELESLLPRVKNYSVAVRESGDSIVFLHQLVKGGCDHSYGIEVARLAGMPSVLIGRAKAILKRLEQNDLSPMRKGQAGRVADSRQFSLFPVQDPVETEVLEPEAHPVLEALRALDLSNLTPVQAMVTLDTWKRALNEDATE